MYSINWNSGKKCVVRRKTLQTGSALPVLDHLHLCLKAVERGNCNGRWWEHQWFPLLHFPRTSLWSCVYFRQSGGQVLLTFDKDRLPRDNWLIKGQIAVGAKPIFKYSSLGLYHYVNFRKVLKKYSQGFWRQTSGILWIFTLPLPYGVRCKKKRTADGNQL